MPGFRRYRWAGVAVVALSAAPRAVQACVLAGVDSGVCITESAFAEATSFCTSLVRYPVCVPTPLPEFPELSATAKV